MVAVPCVEYGLAFPVRYASRLVERGLGVAGFAELLLIVINVCWCVNYQCT